MRFLDERAKREILVQWDATKARWQRGEITGAGVPDQDIVPWCDRINQLPGVCTLQSCAGHLENGIFRPGHLWVWMSPNVAERLESRVFLLVSSADLIDDVSKRFLRDGKEIASITFFGNERDLLGASVALIYGFLCGVCDPTNC